MSAALLAREPDAKYLVTREAPLLQHFDVLATAPGGVARLRELILTLAVQGKLVPQDAGDEPAGVLLEGIRAEKDRLIAAGKIKRDKLIVEIAEKDKPFALPSGWTWVRFGDASINRDGERIPVSSADRERREKRYDYYGASGVIDKIDGFLFDKTLLLIGEDGANLINRSTPIAFLASGQYWVNNHAHVIDATHEELLSYFSLFINAISLVPYVTGTAQPKMNQAKLNSIVVALPPLAEQSHIVTRVEELMRLCDALEAKGRLEAAQHAQLVGTLLGTLTDCRTPEELAEHWQRVAAHFDLLLDRPEAVDALEQAVLHLATSGQLTDRQPSDKDLPVLPASNASVDPLFDVPPGWAWFSLGELATLVTSGSRSWKDFYAKEGATFIRSQDIKYDRLEYDNRAFVKLPRTAEGMRTQVQARDLLITITGANVGKAAVVPDRVDEAYVSQHVALVRLRDTRMADFLHLWLVNGLGGRRALLGESYGAKPGLNLKNVKDLAVPLPPLSEQRRIVARVESLRRLCADLRQQLSAAQSTQAQLARTLLQAATG